MIMCALFSVSVWVEGIVLRSAVAQNIRLIGVGDLYVVNPEVIAGRQGRPDPERQEQGNGQPQDNQFHGAFHGSHPPIFSDVCIIRGISLYRAGYRIANCFSTVFHQ